MRKLVTAKNVQSAVGVMKMLSKRNVKVKWGLLQT